MIRHTLQLASTVLFIVALMALPGCGGSKPAASKKAPALKSASGHYEGDGHDHSKDKGVHSGHDHEKEAKTK